MENRSKGFAIVAMLVITAGSGRAQTPAEPPDRGLSLKEAVSLAVRNSRDIAAARLRLNIADKTTTLSRSFFRPNLYTGSGAAYTSGFPQAPGGAPTIFNISYVQTVFNRPLTGELRAAEERTKAERLEIDRMQDAVILQAATLYLELAKVRHTLKLLRTERLSAVKIADVTRARAGEGLELPIEATRAQLTAAKVEVRIVQNESREETLTSLLRDLTGLGEQPFEVSTEEFAAMVTQPATDLVEMAIANSLELKTAEHERRARELRLKGEKGGYLPTIDMVGYFGVYSRANNFEDFFRKFQRTGVTIGVRAQIPIFSSRTSAQVGLAQSELTAAEMQLKSKRAEISVVVRQQARAGREAEAQREVARLELQLAQENVRVIQAQFDEGRAGLRELERARVEENEKWMQFVDAQFQQQKAHLELLRSTGQIAKVLQ
ncbi:MAG: TolC family protein [Acidobacteria bacterium]|nr:TolC family protein [Acidobacteriota bacterium]